MWRRFPQKKPGLPPEKGEEMKRENIPLGIRFSIIDRAFKYQIDEGAKQLGLTAVQMRILGELSRLEASGAEEVNQRDLEQAEQVTHPTMTATISRLEKNGFVTCTTSSIDRRYKKISCTEKSANLYQELAAKDDNVVKEVCRGLTEEEMQMLFRITDKMVANISAMRLGQKTE